MTTCKHIRTRCLECGEVTFKEDPLASRFIVAWLALLVLGVALRSNLLLYCFGAVGLILLLLVVFGAEIDHLRHRNRARP